VPDDTVMDSSGNIYATGDFSGTMTFGPGEVNETILTGAGESDIFVAKFESGGALLWAKRAGGDTFEQATGIAVDSSGNGYVTGDFWGTAIFGPGEPNETTLTSVKGTRNIFVAKYDASGSLIWAKRAGGEQIYFGYTYGDGIAVDGSGNSYVTGRFSGTAIFGSGEVNETTLTGEGLFVAKYDSNGALVWAKQAGGASPNGIAVDGFGNSYVTGVFHRTVTFGPGELNETTLTAGGWDNIFVAKYDPSGAFLWAKRAGGTTSDPGKGIAVDGSGNSYVTGSFSGTATFGAGEVNEITLTTAGDNDVFVAKFGANKAVLDFSGDGLSDIGVFRNGGMYMDLNGNDQWDGCGMDGCYVFGSAEDQAIVGDWTRSGQAMLGVYRGGGWYLDLNGNNQWDGCGVDGCYVFGSAGDIPAN